MEVVIWRSQCPGPAGSCRRIVEADLKDLRSALGGLQSQLNPAEPASVAGRQRQALQEERLLLLPQAGVETPIQPCICEVLDVTVCRDFQLE